VLLYCNIMELSQLWESVKQYGMIVNLTGQNGLDAWQPLKKVFARQTITDADGTLVNAIPVKQSMIDMITANYHANNDLKYPDASEADLADHRYATITIGDTTMDNTIDHDHFFLQHMRIPSMSDFKLPLTKILQIAYNAGQLDAVRMRGKYARDVMNFYTTHQMSDIDQYIDPADLMVEDRVIDGGSMDQCVDRYRAKYLKYNKKFINLIDYKVIH
jgi:hypothetical protein